MKTYHILPAVALLLVAIMTIGCTDPQKLTERKVIAEANDMLAKKGVSEIYVPISVGQFECNDPSLRRTFAELEVAGFITYEVTRYAWWEKSLISRKKPYEVQKGYGWWSWTDTEYKWVKETVYNFEDHYIVDVALTKAGDKIAIDVLPKHKDVDEDLIEIEVDPTMYKWNQVDLSEKFEEISNPFIKPKKEKPAESTVVTKKTTKSTTKPKTDKDETERIDQKQYEAYTQLNLSSDVIYFKAGEVRATKARNILLKSPMGILTAEAEIIIETKNVTDAGRILRGLENGQKDRDDVELIYYIDKGWVIEDK